MSARQNYLAVRRVVSRVWHRVGFIHAVTMGALLIYGLGIALYVITESR